MKEEEIKWSPADLKLFKDMGIDPCRVENQLKSFTRGFPFLNLNRPCSVNDGIRSFNQDQLLHYEELYETAALSGRVMKFVPASGAATRMFQELSPFRNNDNENADKNLILSGGEQERQLQTFMKNIKSFAFHEDLDTMMSRKGLSLEKALSREEYKTVLDYLLGPTGLNLADMPKGLIPFHACPDQKPRTPVEEHLCEAVEYVLDRKQRARIHYTVSSEHLESFRQHIEKAVSAPSWKNINFKVEFSIQSPSTDTIAVDLENRPLRDEKNKLIFRPGGHGALLKNLQDTGGDIVFIKNIDNVLPENRAGKLSIYKKALGGYLIELQKEIFYLLSQLHSEKSPGRAVNEARSFVEYVFSDNINPCKCAEEEKKGLVSILNRPLRVCGMVKNEGEPGGGPFWVNLKNGTSSCQIVESAQVDKNSSSQKYIWESATHFNPVDLVCGIRDYNGNPFNLQDFVDDDTGFISIKSINGRKMKALELPGLWNGAMARWNTVFVEIPLATFNPVKTIFDLLRAEHRFSD